MNSVIRSLSYPQLKINEEKTTYITPKFHRTVTGLTITNDRRVTIGREKKRTIRAAVHKASKQEMTSSELQSLAGMLAYVKSVEPAFIGVLKQKYGDDVVSRIQKTVIIKRRMRQTSRQV